MVTHLDYCVWRDLLALPTLPEDDRAFLHSVEDEPTYTEAQHARINALWDRYLKPTHTEEDPS